MSVLCVYAPTARALPGVKANSNNELQDTIEFLRMTFKCLWMTSMLGWYGDEKWQDVVGKHGLDEKIESGEKFL